LTPEQAAELEARRSRANVLRAFETTTLTRSNFCALKGMTDAALEAVLVQARADRGDRHDAAPQRPHRGGSR
jgi:ProP effector